MTFVYLIMVHKYPHQLEMLVRTLQCSNVFFIIHADKKVSISEFKNLLPTAENIIFCNRFKVSWGGFGMIEATLEMLRTMYERNIKPDYVHLLSGQDFPLVSNEKLFRFFSEHRGANFTEAYTLPSPRLNEQGLNRIRYKWFIEDEGYQKSLQLVEIQKERNMIRAQLSDICPYNGSQWWSLTGDCVQWLYQTCRSGNRLYDFYKYTFCPDEMLFQTALYNSEWKNTITGNNLRCINWDDGPEYPKIWRLDDFEYLMQSKRLFARKFDETADSTILQKLIYNLKYGKND